MATGGGPSPPTHGDRRKALTCTLCLEIFTIPKLLPCSHTYCLKCLEDLTNGRSSPTFPCPQCRSQVTIPKGGVSAFQNNFYVYPEDLDIAREGTHCLIHPKQDLDLYCKDCEVLVCLKCVLTRHTGHLTQDLPDAAREAVQQLRQDDDRLQTAVSFMTWEAEEEEGEQRNLQDKKAAVKTSILNKHATLVAVADMCRDELLAATDTVCTQTEKEVSKRLNTMTSDLQTLIHLQQRVQQTHLSDTACTQVTLAKELREGTGNDQSIEKMISVQRSSIHCPVLNSSITLDTLKDTVRGFFGVAGIVKMNVTRPEVKVKKQFTCRKEKDTEVYSLCPLDDGNVWVSYANCGLRNNVPIDMFDESGVHQRSCDMFSGKNSMKSRGSGKKIVLKQPDSIINTLSKYKGHDNNHLALCNTLNGKATISRLKVTPFRIESELEFTINTRPHRAFDVDFSEEMYAVVEEPRTADQQRQVKLYQRNRPDAMATYTPPSKLFNPSDVCFFTLGGEEVLMIADEAGDSIHVVHVQKKGSMTFVRYLAPGCPLLVQPTTLNTDHKGRLWVACRGGVVLTMSPIAS